MAIDENILLRQFNNIEHSPISPTMLQLFIVVVITLHINHITCVDVVHRRCNHVDCIPCIRSCISIVNQYLSFAPIT